LHHINSEARNLRDSTTGIGLFWRVKPVRRFENESAAFSAAFAEFFAKAMKPILRFSYSVAAKPPGPRGNLPSSPVAARRLEAADEWRGINGLKPPHPDKAAAPAAQKAAQSDFPGIS
jgi:hypothetical protein